ncbi:MAG: DUF72 domain-containing protein [Leptolyngbyaceae cyanobacterium SL_1_1]|nr:DUF72 domain-containing protein [Leptolyngbyaceae cyanobacterium RM1_1_2]NJO10739.1 DUF72 domain-containing protein [Leptolyngbyaceae cyanobacterium SL_1_1]
MSDAFLIGCAVWAYKDWVGEFYPAGSRAGDFLRLYSQRLMAVEGNTTFYSVPSQSMVQRWAAETPDTFKFCLKLPRLISHQGALSPRLPEAIAFLERVAPLGDRLGPCFAQLPPSYSPALLGDLANFVSQWPHPQVPLAVEVRHPDWFKPPYQAQLNQLLVQHQCGRVLLDTRPIYDCLAEGLPDVQLNSERRKPQVPLQPIITAPFSLIRYISHPELALNQQYLAEWVFRLQQWLSQGTQVYFFVHCPVEAKSPAIARHFHQLLQQQGVVKQPLPWQHSQAPAQLTLF